MVDFDKMFPDEREMGETKLRQCQLVMLRMLKIYDYLCLKHNIEYFFTGGSLIGAIRHHGFIPWDDDLDVGMTRDNYNKFVKLAVPELPKDIFFQSPETDSFYPSCDMVDARLRDRYSSYKHLDTPDNKWHEGLQLDIFVYDKAFFPSNFLIITQNIIINIFKSAKLRANVLTWLSKVAPSGAVYSSNYLQGYGLIKIGTYKTGPEIAQLIRAKFEDMEVYIPVGYDSYLKRQYKNYMQIPPAEKQLSTHNVIAEPFKPCNHKESLTWKSKKMLTNDNF